MSDSFFHFRASVQESCGILTTEFDPIQRLVWVSDALGYVRSLEQRSPTTYNRHLSWKAFHNGVTSLHVAGASEQDLRVVVGGRYQVRIHRTSGSLLHVYNHPYDNITCSLLDNSQAPRRIFFGGETKHLYGVDCGTWETFADVTLPSICTAVKRCRNQLAVGTGIGVVHIREASSLNDVCRIGAFHGAITDFACRDNYMAITGLNNFAMSNKLKVYDLRKVTTEPAVKIAFEDGSMPRNVIRHPLDTSCVITCTNTGIYFVNVTTGSIDAERSFTFPEPLQHRVSSLSMSQTAEVVAVGDVAGNLHVWNTKPSALINAGGSLFDVVDRPHKKLGLQRTPPEEADSFFANLSYEPDGQYFSDWPPPNHVVLVSPIPREIDTKKFPNLPVSKTVCAIPNPSLRNVQEAYVPLEANPYPFNERIGPDLRPASVATQLKLLRNPGVALTRASQAPIGDLGLFSQLDFDMERAYLEHYESETLNVVQTVTGLENFLPESWMNSMIQALYHLFPQQWPLRKSIMNHWCRRRFCCSCELSMIFHNMYSHSTHKCGLRMLPISHFVRTLRNLDSFVTANLVNRVPASQEESIQMMHDLLLTMIHSIHADFSVHESVRYSGALAQVEAVQEWFGVHWENPATKRPKFVWSVPTGSKSVEEGLQKAFSEHSDMQQLPPIVAITLNGGNVEEPLEPPGMLTFTKHKSMASSYTLMCKIVYVYDEHFVCITRVSPDKDSWVLINDHIAHPLPEERSTFSSDFGIPVVAFYCQENFQPKRRHDTKVFSLASVVRLLEQDDTAKREKWYNVVESLARTTPTINIPRNLTSSLQEGTLVAIDAEYIVLDWGRLRCKSPMSLARVSCVLGSTQECFLDDYIAVSEPVQDYVTKYSGIHPGDLTVDLSQKPLTTLKSCWTKLKVMVSAGVKFVGHGLPQDLRVMHIVIPKAQLLDTVEIYRLPSQRKVSLKFLMFYVFGESVQKQEHDSIEDARCALRLYLKYKELEELGQFDGFLQELYLKGTELNWTVPGA
eukprot:PhF_6_TR40816/c0_g1_i1/m.61721/K12571/PAN2; PAB-dependent poly(A)-specific ribonuclease subunit 2